MNPWRLASLNRAIAQNPDAAVNFLLRGEYWLTQREYIAASQDYQKAAALAAEALLSDEWGYLYQSYLDRASEALAWLGNQMQGPLPAPASLENLPNPSQGPQDAV